MRGRRYKCVQCGSSLCDLEGDSPYWHLVEGCLTGPYCEKCAEKLGACFDEKRPWVPQVPWLVGNLK